MFRIIRTLLAAGIGLLAALGSAHAAGDIEQPAYDISKQSEGVELRGYAPHLVAEVTVEAGSMREASSKGFRLLAGYIFGGNQGTDKIAMTAPVTTQEKTQGTRIAMTAPVTMSEKQDGAYTVRFSMPSKWTLDTLPVPNNKSIELKQIEAHERAAYRFTGDRSQAQIDAASAKLASFLAEQGLKAVSPVIIAGYDGPNVPIEKRRWEVMRIVE